MKRTKKFPFIDLALHLDELDFLPEPGLCATVYESKLGKKGLMLLSQLKPEHHDLTRLRIKDRELGYWGYEGRQYNKYRYYRLNKFRKTLLAFCAVLNNEV